MDAIVCLLKYCLLPEHCQCNRFTSKDTAASCDFAELTAELQSTCSNTTQASAAIELSCAYARDEEAAAVRTKRKANTAVFDIPDAAKSYNVSSMMSAYVRLLMTHLHSVHYGPLCYQLEWSAVDNIRCKNLLISVYTD